MGRELLGSCTLILGMESGFFLIPTGSRGELLEQGQCIVTGGFGVPRRRRSTYYLASPAQSSTKICYENLRVQILVGHCFVTFMIIISPEPKNLRLFVLRKVFVSLEHDFFPPFQFLKREEKRKEKEKKRDGECNCDDKVTLNDLGVSRFSFVVRFSPNTFFQVPLASNIDLRAAVVALVPLSFFFWVCRCMINYSFALLPHRLLSFSFVHERASRSKEFVTIVVDRHATRRQNLKVAQRGREEGGKQNERCRQIMDSISI